MSRPIGDSKLIHLCLLRARTAEGIAQDLDADVEQVRAALERLVANERLRRVRPGRVTAYRMLRRSSSARGSMEHRKETAASRMNAGVARVGLRERVRKAIAGGPVTRGELIDEFGSGAADALGWLTAKGEVDFDEATGTYRRALGLAA